MPTNYLLPIEYSVTNELHISNLVNMDTTFHDRLTNLVLGDSEVQFRWLSVGENDDCNQVDHH